MKVEKTKKGGFFSGISLNIIGAIVLLLILFGAISSVIGLISFTNSLKKEYSETTYHMAETATMLVSGDRIADYIAGEYKEEYQTTSGYLDAYCQKMHVSLVYVISVDTSDYGRFVSVYNVVNNTVDNTSYTPWELGFERETTNDEYRQKYEALYNKQSTYETIYRTQTVNGIHPHITTIVPVKNSAGDVTALLCIQRPMSELHAARRPYLIQIATSTVLLAVVSSVFAAVFIRRQFITPIKKVSDEAERFARENTKGEGLGKVSRYKELSALASSIDTMETDMVRYIENLTAATEEKGRIKTELSLASTIQENSIPNVFPAFPDRSDFDIFASMTPAKDVGGDFYNFYLIDDDHLAVVIGDVSGKGIPAALFMMVTNIIISDRTKMGGSPAEILNYVNKNICEHNKAEMFVTVWLGILELSTGKLIASNAGHEYPIIKSPDGDFEVLKDKHGFVVGGMSDFKYKDYELTLKPGSKLFIYTDGVAEATDEQNGMFGMERTLQALNAEKDGSPEQILKNVRAEIDNFVNGAEQFDDLTMLCLQYKGKDQ